VDGSPVGRTQLFFKSGSTTVGNKTTTIKVQALPGFTAPNRADLILWSRLRPEQKRRNRAPARAPVSGPPGGQYDSRESDVTEMA